MKSIGVLLFASVCFLGLSIARAEPSTQPANDTKGAISGTVTNDGKPLANAAVRLMQPNNPANTSDTDKNDKAARKAARKAGHGKRVLVAETTTDDKGNFSFNDVPTGQYVVVVRDRETNMAGSTAVTVADHQSAAVSITAREHKAGKQKNKGK